MTDSNKKSEKGVRRLAEVPVVLTAYLKVELPEGCTLDGTVNLLDGDDPDGEIIATVFEQMGQSEELSDLFCLFKGAASAHHRNYPSTRITYSPLQIPEQELTDG